MKKILTFTLFMALFSGLFAQNIGIMLGGGVSNMKFYTDDAEFNSYMNDSIGQMSVYHVGFNFENPIVDKSLYLQFALHAMGKGFITNDESVYLKMHYVHIPIELKYKMNFNSDYNFYVSAGPYIAFKLGGEYYDKDLMELAAADTTGTIVFDPEIKFGKTEEDDIQPFDYGLNFGAGFGLSNFELGYNYGLGLADVSTFSDQTITSLDFDKFRWSHGYHTFTAAYYFTRD